MFVSICLLTHNRASILARSITSILAQTHKHFELIINDNASTDQTEILCKEWVAKDERIKYIRNRENVGFADNQNLAVIRAKSEYIALLHDGDIYKPTLIEKWLEALLLNPDAAFVFNRYESLDSAGNKIGCIRVNQDGVEYNLGSNLKLYDFMLKKEGSPIFGMVMLRRSKVQAAGPFDQRLRNLADVDMWYRLLLKNKFVFLDEALIQIAPREVDHVIKPSNWKIQIQYELIYIVNALRRNPDSFGLFSRLDIDLMLLRRSVRWICWCVLKKQITGIKDGLRHIAGYLHRKREILLDSGRVHGSWEEIESLSRKV